MHHDEFSWIENREAFKARQRACIESRMEDRVEGGVLPYREVFVPKASHSLLGASLLAEGAAGVLILAGGAGSRFNITEHKALAPAAFVSRKNLIAMLFERFLAIVRLYQRPFPVAIMTSPLNHEAIFAYCKKQVFFGLDPCFFDFLVQPLWPYCDIHGEWIYNEAGLLQSGPNGNGAAFHLFVQAGLLEKWRWLGVRYLNVIPVNNSLARPLDPALLGFQYAHNAELVLKAIRRRAAHEPLGLLVQKNLKAPGGVLEYLDAGNVSSLVDEGGALRFLFAYTGMFSISLKAVAKASERLLTALPWHPVLKEVSIDGEKQWVWKFELFLFDNFARLAPWQALEVSREDGYAPLKSISGEDSLADVQLALLLRDRRLFQALTKVVPPVEPFELPALLGCL